MQKNNINLLKHALSVHLQYVLAVHLQCVEKMLNLSYNKGQKIRMLILIMEGDLK